LAELDNQIAIVEKNYEILGQKHEKSNGATIPTKEELVKKANTLHGAELQKYYIQLRDDLNESRVHGATGLELALKLAEEIKEMKSREIKVTSNDEATAKLLEKVKFAFLAGIPSSIEISNKYEIVGSSSVKFDPNLDLYIWNVNRKEHMYIAQFGIGDDKPQGNLAFTWITSQLVGDGQTKVHLLPAPGKNRFYIFTPYFNHYYYASDTCFEEVEGNSSSTWRNVFSTPDLSEKCIWEFEKQYDDVYRIKHVSTGNYLCTGDTKDYERRKVYVWNGVGEPEYGLWRVHDS